ncbi:AMP-binding protein [Streptomyces nogalater]
MLYTSGTTGPAKAFTNPHGNLTYGRGPEGLLQFENPTPLLAPMPLGTTSSATTVAIIAVTSPSALVLAAVDDVERMAQLVSRHRIGSVMITPWIAMRMLAARLGERHDLGCVERVAIASAPLAPALSRALLKLFPAAELNTAYSQSEAVPAVVVNTFDPARPGTLGRAAPGTGLRIADALGTELPPGEVGEIQLRSAAPGRRYLDARRDAEVRIDGWIRTGDLGHLDEDGWLHLFDRGSDVLDSAGVPVSSVAVEAALYEHPAVREAAVVAAGSGPAAVVVLEDPAAARPARLPRRTARTAPAARPGRDPGVAAARHHRQGAQADPAPGTRRPVAGPAVRARGTGRGVPGGCRTPRVPLPFRSAQRRSVLDQAPGPEPSRSALGAAGIAGCGSAHPR